MFVWYPRSLKAFNFDNFENLHNSFLRPEYFIDYFCENWFLVRLWYPSCVYFSAQRQYTPVHLWNNFPCIWTLPYTTYEPIFLYLTTHEPIFLYCILLTNQYFYTVYYLRTNISIPYTTHEPIFLYRILLTNQYFYTVYYSGTNIMCVLRRKAGK